MNGLFARALQVYSASSREYELKRSEFMVGGKFFRSLVLRGLVGISAVAVLATGFFSTAVAEDEKLAFDDKFTLRVASYSVQNADTDILVADSDTGIGVAYSFRDDFGGDESVTVPRIDAAYRFNDAHRIDFATFEIYRSGREVLLLEVDLDDQSYAIGDTLITDLDYQVFRVSYGYSFYRSDRVELGISAGLHLTNYDFSYQLADGSKDDSVDATGPLPMFGMRVSYALTPRWGVHFLSEAFYFEIDDAYKGSFTISELDIEYRFNNYFTLGAGISRFATDLDADDSDWKGSITDTHRGLLIYGSFHL